LMPSVTRTPKDTLPGELGVGLHGKEGFQGGWVAKVVEGDGGEGRGWGVGGVGQGQEGEFHGSRVGRHQGSRRNRPTYVNTMLTTPAAVRLDEPTRVREATEPDGGVSTRRYRSCRWSTYVMYVLRSTVSGALSAVVNAGRVLTVGAAVGGDERGGGATKA
jgi:hypothetical protein